MTQSFVISFAMESIRMAVLLSAPMLAGALVIGILISIFQAVTQIQEQTLSIIPKMGIILGIIALLFPWLLTQATTYMASVFTNFPRFIGG
ncbi:MAG: flagellar biosynthesis protein FliQ [SAR324 cluster bacterium]|nr:flagellar biosynthesis protein FliQ [SAR324 cluster bacterium]MBF0350641.1 flagellar biosynthesis protein FliQ [SAR324 cluster bacterium]